MEEKYQVSAKFLRQESYRDKLTGQTIGCKELRFKIAQVVAQNSSRSFFSDMDARWLAGLIVRTDSGSGELEVQAIKSDIESLSLTTSQLTALNPKAKASGLLQAVNALNAWHISPERTKSEKIDQLLLQLATKLSLNESLLEQSL